MPNGFLEITPSFHLPLSELDYQASRSGGPGGQHVNTSSTRIELWWDLAKSPSLDPERRELLLRRLASRLDSDGRLRLVSSGTRSQLRNKEAATERLQTLLAEAVIPPKKRKRTRPSKAAKAARLEGKRRRAATKQRRRAPLSDD
jgi:ribosome-associated protein